MSNASPAAAPIVSPSTKTELRNVFISYSRQDAKFAQRLAGDLRSNGVKVWIDQAEIRGGADWRDRIEQALSDSAAFLLIVSPSSRNSPVVRQELRFAADMNMPIVPVLCRKTRPWFDIAGMHYVNFSEWYDRGLAELLGKQIPYPTVWRRILIFLKRARTVLAALAITAVVAAVLYWSTPSETSLAIRGTDEKDPAMFIVKVHNDGGRRSKLVDGTFALEFEGLPILPHTDVVLLDAAKVRSIRGHSDVYVRLTTNSYFTPREKSANCFPVEEEIEPLIPKGKVFLTVKVEESGHRMERRRTVAVPASLIKPFLLRAYPDNVPTQCY